MGRVRCVGWWGPGSGLPDPRSLVDPAWRADQRSAVVAYLRAGAPLTGFLGFSTCRFECGVPREQMGSFDLTDGRWVWPEGLAHYVEAHAVRLPEEFVDDMARHAFRIGDLRIEPNEASNERDDPYDREFWKAWSRSHA